MRLTRVEISESNLRFNIQKIKSLSTNSKITAMVKANAYGHGLRLYIPILRSASIEYLGFAFLDEAIEARDCGDKGNVMVLVSASENEAEAFLDFNLETVFSSVDILKVFNEKAKVRGMVTNAHLFIDTGMHRDGVSPDKALDFMKVASQMSNVNIIGICSHLSTSDSEDLTFAHKQLSLFNQTVNKLENEGFTFKYRHISNSAGLLNVPCSECNLVRPGISFHGLMGDQSLAKRMSLRPTLEWKSKVQLIQSVNRGESVGYSLKWIADKDTNVAVIPIGYGDGLLRTLTNRMKVLINGKFYPQVGTICMDEMMVDIGNDNVSIYDEVVIIGKQGTNEITIYDHAEMAGTISYEISSLITSRVPRILVP